MTISAVSNLAVSPEEDRRQQFYVQLLQDSRNVNGLLDLLGLVVEREDWTRLRDVDGQPLTFRAYIELPYGDGGIGWSVDNLRIILRLKHDHETPGREIAETVARLGWMRERVEDLLLTDRPRSGPKPNGAISLPRNEIRQGNSSAYLRSRLAQEAPDVLERMKAGEFRSVRAAAREAGIIKDKTPLEKAQWAWGKLTQQERQEFLEWIRTTEKP